MEFQLIIGSVVIVLIVFFVYLKRTQGHQESNLPMVNQPNSPAVSEDVNLPVVNQQNSPMVGQNEAPVQNELDNNGPQQQ